MVGDDDFDDYLNEVSGEDVSSGQDSTFQTDQPTKEPSAPPEFGTQTNTKDQQAGKQATAVPQAAPATTGLRRHALGGFVNAEGDIVDEKGAVIAQKGTVRRVYEENGRLRQRLSDLEKQTHEFSSRSGEANVLNGAPTRLGLDNNDVATALDLAARVKRGDILGVAKDMVARAAAAGHNVTEIVGNEVGDSVDMRALKGMLDTHLGPISQVRQEAEQNQQIQHRAREQYTKFIDENPNAEIHEFEIASIARNDGISPQKAYNALRDFAVRNKLDFSIPLDAQVRALQAQKATGRAPVQVKPMPNGAAVTNGNGVQPPVVQYADPNDDWSTIIRDAQRTMRQ